MMRYVLAIVIASLFLIASCGETGPVNPAIDVPFIGGNDGVEMGLIDGMPPAAVYDGDRMTFGIGVALKNVGEADIGPSSTYNNTHLEVTVQGFPPSVFGVTSGNLTQDLDDRTLLGAKKNFDGSILDGQLQRVTFNGLAYQGVLQGNYVQNFLVNLCYDYSNVATVPVCFKDDVIENIEDVQICTLTGEKHPQNSGGPIHVTSVVQNPLDPHEVMVNFVIEHVGTGDFYGRGSGDFPWSMPPVDGETCDPSITNTNKYRLGIELSADTGSDMEIRCSNFGDGSRGVVTLYQGAPTTVTCTLTGSLVGNTAERPYTELLTITTWYRYGESLVQPVVIQAVGARDE